MKLKAEDRSKFLKTAAASAYLGVSPRYLRDLMSQGRIPFSRIGPRCQLFKRTDLDAFVDQHTIHAV